jgi:hypothetical protein
MEMYSTKEAARIPGLSQNHARLLARKSLIKDKRLGHDWAMLELDCTGKKKPKRG